MRRGDDAGASKSMFWGVTPGTWDRTGEGPYNVGNKGGGQEGLR